MMQATAVHHNQHTNIRFYRPDALPTPNRVKVLKINSSSKHSEPITSDDVIRTCKDKDKDQAYKDQDKDKD